MTKCISVIMAMTLAGFAAEEDLDRVWTNSEGKQFFGTYVNYDSETDLVTIAKGGREYDVAFESLSEADKDFVEDQAIKAKQGKAVDRPESQAVTDEDLKAEAKRRGVNMQVSEIFRVSHYNTTLIATSCTSIGIRSKVPDSFMVVGDVLKQRGGKATRNLQARLELVKFEWVNTIREGREEGRYRMPFYKASSIRPASSRYIRAAERGR